MKKNDRSTDAFWLCLMGGQETRWMRDESLFFIACGWGAYPVSFCVDGVVVVDFLVDDRKVP